MLSYSKGVYDKLFKKINVIDAREPTDELVSKAHYDSNYQNLKKEIENLEKMMLKTSNFIGAPFLN